MSKITVNMGHPIISGYQYGRTDDFELTSIFGAGPGTDVLNLKDWAQANGVYQNSYPTNYAVSPSSVGVFAFLATTSTGTTAGYNTSLTGAVNQVLQSSYQATGLNASAGGAVVAVASPSGITPSMTISNTQNPVLGLNEPALATGTGLLSAYQTPVNPVLQSITGTVKMSYFNGNSVVTV